VQKSEDKEEIRTIEITLVNTYCLSSVYYDIRRLVEGGNRGQLDIVGMLEFRKSEWSK
jgi:hypothetical protein